MDLTGSLVDTHLRIYPNKTLTLFLKSLPENDNIPTNILKLIGREEKHPKEDSQLNSVQLIIEDFENLCRFKSIIKNKQADDKDNEKTGSKQDETTNVDDKNPEKDTEKIPEKEKLNENNKIFLTTSDMDWLYNYLHKRRSQSNIPYLHELLEGCNIEMPENSVLKRNPVLEERCVKLRSQQEAREYRKMTKTVDNVRMRFPEDSISYQLKQINRQLIAIGQFIISIFAGFLFGFRGVEWMVGNLDFGFRLLLGVMCALVIALAEIYFLAKKLNEELNIAETIQLGGPPKFEKEAKQFHKIMLEKEHQD